MDVTGVDLGLVEDKIERAVREIYNQVLLTEAGSARLILVLPSMLPHPLLSTVITTFFSRWKYSSITLLSSPTMAAVGAGVRSAIVVDIGWAETTVTSIYEYREMGSRRSTMAMKALVKELGRTLNAHRQENGEALPPVDFELAEELMARMVWCSPQRSAKDKSQHDSAATENGDEQEVELDWPTGTSSDLVKVPFAIFSKPVEKVFLGPETGSYVPDDQEHSLPMLVYASLRALIPDARAVCMSRIVIVGGGSGIPGLSQRIVGEVEALVRQYGWSEVRGELADKQRELRALRQGPAEKAHACYRVSLSPGKDYVEERLQKKQAKDDLPTVQGEMRLIESLGVWAGASLLASLKIRGLVEIEREKFLQHGLAGAQRDVDMGMLPHRSGHGAGLSKSSASDQASWTLAGWA
jgi:actin-related protein